MWTGVNLYIFCKSPPAQSGDASTRDSIADNRISAERCKNVAALIFEILRNHAAHQTACGLRRLQSPQSLTSLRQPRSTFARDLQKPADWGLSFSLKVSARSSETNPSADGSSYARHANQYTAPDDDSKERADDIKALTISEVNC